jgi:hypothetical protein
MNYRKQYSLLISKYGSHTKPGDVFVERHHILPKSLGGTNEVDNLVYLTARAHLVAHKLLYKIYKNRQMALALKRMCEAPKHSSRPNISGRDYEYARKCLSKSMIGVSREDLLGDRNPMRRPEVAAKISAHKTEYWKDSSRRERAARGAAKSYIITDPSGNTISVFNLKEYCVNNKLNYSSLLYAAKTGGNPRRAKGYTCKEVTTLCE